MHVEPDILPVLSFVIKPECVVDHLASVFLLSQLVNVSLKYN